MSKQEFFVNLGVEGISSFERDMNKAIKGTNNLNASFDTTTDKAKEVARDIGKLGDEVSESFNKVSRSTTDVIKNIQSLTRDVASGLRAGLGLSKSILGDDNALTKLIHSAKLANTKVLDALAATRRFVKIREEIKAGKIPDEIQNITDAFNGLKNVFNKIFGKGKNPMSEFSKILGSEISIITSYINKLKSIISIKDIIPKLKEFPAKLSETFNSIKTWLSPTIADLKSKFSSFKNTIFENFNKSGVSEKLSSFFSLIKTNISAFGNSVKQVFESIKPHFTSFAAQLGSIFTSKNLLNGLSGIKSGIASLLPSLASLTPLLVGLGTGIGVVAGLGFGIKAAFDGIKLEPIQNAFRNLTSDIGGSEIVLGKLREQAQGTISNFELMRMTNLALAGATGDVKQALGEALPNLLRAARVQAAATGQSVEFLYNSLITGVKRSSPLLIDNTGIVLKAGQANIEYAASIGKSVQEMTAADKQMALLMATVEASDAAVIAAGGVYLTNADRIASMKNAFKNLYDQLGVVMQPILTMILQLGMGFSQLVESILSPIIQLLSPLILAIQAIGNGIMSALQPVLVLVVPLFRVLWEAVMLVANAFNLLVIQPVGFFFEAIGALVGIVAQVFRPLGAIIGWVADIFTHLNQRMRDVGAVVDALAQVFRDAFGNAMQAFQPFFERMTGWLDVGLIVIKQWIDNTLLGAASWAGAFAAGISRPFPYIMKLIADLANAIGDFLIGNSPPPKGALSKIDVGGENVMLAWLNGVTGVSLDPVEKVASDVNNALGNIGTFNNEQVTAAFATLDAALLPFQERVDLLKAKLDSIAEPAKEAMDAITRQQDVLLDQFNAGNYAVSEMIKAYDLQKQQINDTVKLQEQELANSELQLTFLKAKQAEERAMLKIQQARLSGVETNTPLIEASEVEKPERISSQKEPSSSGKADIKAEENSGSSGFGGVSTALNNKLNALSPFGEDLMANFAQAYNDTANELDMETQKARLQEGTQKIAQSDLGQKFTQVFTTISDSWTTLTGTMQSAFNNVSSWFEPLTTTINTVFDEANPESALGRLKGFLSYFLPEGETSMLVVINGAIGTITDPLMTFNTLFNFQEAIGYITDLVGWFLTGNATGITSRVQQTINNVRLKVQPFISMFEDMKAGIATAFEGFSAFLGGLMVSPLEGVMNLMVTLINDFLTRFETDINNAINSVNSNSFGALSIPNITLPKLSPFSFAGLEANAVGGGMSAGTFIAGENGAEIVTASKRTSTFPAEFVDAINNFNRLVDDTFSGGYRPTNSSTSNINNSRNINANYNNYGDSGISYAEFLTATGYD